MSVINYKNELHLLFKLFETIKTSDLEVLKFRLRVFQHLLALP